MRASADSLSSNALSAGVITVSSCCSFALCVHLTPAAPTRSDNAAEVSRAAEELYKMTSFSSAVAIDRPEALTDYDRAVFGNGLGASSGGHEASASGAAMQKNGASAEGQSFSPGEAHLDGHRYLMGDGFMLNEDEGPNGSVRTRRVAVMHSRNCLDNRAIIGKLPGVFEALVKAIG